MPQMNKRPLLGFGPIGWVASAVLATMLVMLWRGVDFQYHYIWLLHDILGVDGLFLYLSKFHVWHSLLLLSPSFNLITTTLILPALFIAPRRHGTLRFAIVIVWGLLVPALYPLERHLWRALANDPYQGWLIARTGINVLSCIMLWGVTRSRLVLVLSVGLSAVFATDMLISYLNSPPAANIFPPPHTLDDVKGIVWHVGIGAVMWLWAIRLYRKAPDSGCQWCGYDLRGMSHDCCPECGTAVRDQPDSHANKSA